MKVAMIGTGYVGLVNGVGLANLGNDVFCLDIDQAKIDLLNKGGIPIYEEGLSDLLVRNIREKRIRFTTDAKLAIENSDIIFVCVGTPSSDDGSVDMKYVYEAAKSIGKYINGYKVIVDKSTVPVGTAEKVRQLIKENQKGRGGDYDFDVVSSPEFLREGAALKDFFNPDRIVIGAESDRAKNMMLKLLKPLERTGQPILITDIKSAEMIKYASNSMLATRISFVNELSRLCEKVGADIKVVAKGMGLDNRIGPRFLQAGIGYGGSCFPKDVKGLINTAKENGINLSIITAVDRVNEEQKKLVITYVKRLVPNLKGKKVALWGLAFKPKTDDMREAPSIVLVKDLQREGANVVAFDPEAMENAKKMLKDITYTDNPYDTVRGCDCVVLVTEWSEFGNLDFEKVKSLMKEPNMVDGRNFYDPATIKEAGFNYIAIARRG